MRHHRIQIILAVLLSTSAVHQSDSKLTRIVEHKINKREDVVNKHQRDPGKIFHQAGKLYPISDGMTNTTRLLDVKTIEGRSRPMRNHSHSRNMNGFLPRLPPNQFMQRSYNGRSQKLTPRNRYRYNNARPRMQRAKQHDESITGSFSRWFFTDDSEEVVEPSSKIISRHSPHRPSTYHNYPPYWPSSGSNQQKFNSFPRFQKSRAVSHHRPFVNNKINFVKTECNSCNSVPWTPILKPSAVHNTFSDSQSYDVPTIEVHHDSSGYDSSHRQNIAPPPVVEHSPDTTIPESYGLPLGNIPTGHGLLPPINHVKVSPPGLVPPPPTLLQPIPTDGLIHTLQFPELSQIPVAPIHDSNQFLQVDTPDLVPPIAPQKTVSNVVFTISESGPGHNEPLIDNHIGQPGPIHGSDQHSESSSFVNTHLISHIDGQFNPYNPNNNHVNLDIVKSVPVAEYTSSIQYPLQIIQSPQYIDISPQPNDTKLDPPTYEKQPQTGSQKISDILFGLVKDDNPNKPVIDAAPSGSRLLEQSSQVQTQQNNQYIPSNGPVISDNSKNNYIESTQLYTQNQQNNQYISSNGPVISDNSKNNYIESTQLYTQNQQYPGNLVFEQHQGPIWTSGSQPFVNSPPHQPKLESGGEALLPDPTSTSWLIPAQSNLAPQWILPVSNPPSIPYPLLPEEEGIASAVNGELSPLPSPQPMNDSKKKKIQIIIPYTTGDHNKEYDQNIVESSQSEIYKTISPGNISQQNNQGQQIAEFSVPTNSSQETKFLQNDLQHILAFNIKELLNEEVEKPKAEQNIRLQKNIDNWTALEYSNHKIVSKKEPLDVISYANAVTSIPGTSISHLLLTSKKIPDKYLTTTPVPAFDEPATTHFPQTSGVSVESKPFTTKTYDTSGLYSTVTRIAPTTTTLRTIVRDVLKEKPNHRNGYTEVVKTKANQWGKLNENLVLPENVSNRTTTTGWSNKKPTGHDENVYVVTPVSVWQPSGDVNKRTTRQVFMTEKPELGNVTLSQEATKSYIAKLFGNKTERAKISKFNKPKLIQKFFATTKAPPRNITKIEIPKTKVGTDNDVNEDRETDRKSINDVFPFRNGGELPLELAIANSTTEAVTVAVANRNGLIKQAKDVSKTVKKQSAVDVSPTTSTEAPESTTTELLDEDSSTEILIFPDEEGFGLKIAKEEKSNGTNRSKNSLTDSPAKQKTEKNSSNLPAGIFGETKRVHVKGRENSSTSDLKSITDTIRLLKEYLTDDSDELPEEKTDGTEKLEDRP